MDQDGGGGPWFRPHYARWESSSSSQKEGGSPSPIIAHFYCGQTTGCIKMSLCMQVGLSPGDFVLDGDPALPQFLAHVYCDQTAVCIRIPLDNEVGLSLGDIVLDGDPAPPPLKRHSPQFLANVRCGQTTGWTMMPLRMEVGLGQVTLCSMETRKKRHSHPSNFGPCLL